MTSRRIVLLGTFDPAFGRNRQLARLAERSGFLVDARSFDPWGEDKVKAAGGGLWVMLRAVGAYARIVSHVLHIGINPASRPRAIVVPHPSQVDAVVIGVFARLMRMRLVIDYFVSLHETVILDRGLGSPRSPKAAVLRAIDTWAARLAHVVITDTPEDADAFARTTGTPRTKWRVVRVGADPSMFHPVAGSVPRPKSVLFYGTYIPLQGIEHIVRASLLLPADYSVTLVGNGQLRHETEKLVRECAAPVRLVDQVPEHELAPLIAESEVCLGVFGAGAKTQRVVPNKVYQCLAVGRPVVTGASPAVEVLGDAVVTVPVADPAAIADAVQSLVEDPARREAVAARGLELFGRMFTDEQLGSDLAAALGDGDDDPLPPLTTMARLRQPFIAEALRIAAPRSILEVGAGQGAVGARLAHRASYVGVEPDADSASVAAARLVAVPGADFRRGGIERIADDETFDMVCAFEVIEHIENDRDALVSWVRHLAPEGHLLLSVPAHRSRFGPSDEAVGHFRRYDAPDIDHLLSSIGFEAVRRWSYGALGGHVLEAGRNAILSRRTRSIPHSSSESTAGRTAASGRLFQPSSRVGGAVTAVAAAPMVLCQRPFARGTFGVGWVVLARRIRGTV